MGDEDGMEKDREILLLLELLYGEAAGQVRHGASPRLLGWCRAFDEWLAERRRKCSAGVASNSVGSWRRLLRQCAKMPWELGPADIEAHAAWLQGQGYAACTIHSAIGIISSFYRWCGEREVDPGCGPGFDPAAGVQRPAVKPWARAELLSLAEVEALLGILRRDDTPLGRRDYAFFLARLRTGVSLAALRRLRWGQIEAGGEGAWVRWRPGAQPVPLPEEVWEALQSYLAASGRLAEIRADACIFAPLIKHLTEMGGSAAQDWRVGSPLAANTLMKSLKLYGRLVCIPEHKLTLRALRGTAIRLRLDSGCSLEEMHAFLDSRNDLKMIKYSLQALPHLPEGCQSGEGAVENEPPLPVRHGKINRPGDGAIHGYYSQVQPVEEVKAILREAVQGVDEQICGLRILARGLMHRQLEARDGAQAARLSGAYLQACGRLAALIKAEPQLAAASAFSEWSMGVLALVYTIAREEGRSPEQELTEILEKALEGEPELAKASRHLAEETAGTRVILRRAFRRAMDAGDTEEYIRLVGVYGEACVRLLGLLKTKGSDSDRMDAYLRKMIDDDIREVNEHPEKTEQSLLWKSCFG